MIRKKSRHRRQGGGRLCGSAGRATWRWLLASVAFLPPPWCVWSFGRFFLSSILRAVPIASFVFACLCVFRVLFAARELHQPRQSCAVTVPRLGCRIRLSLCVCVCDRTLAGCLAHRFCEWCMVHVCCVLLRRRGDEATPARRRCSLLTLRSGHARDEGGNFGGAVHGGRGRRTVVCPPCGPATTFLLTQQLRAKGRERGKFERGNSRRIHIWRRVLNLSVIECLPGHVRMTRLSAASQSVEMFGNGQT